jgi:hypothetical protein
LLAAGGVIEGEVLSNNQLTLPPARPHLRATRFGHAPSDYPAPRGADTRHPRRLPVPRAGMPRPCRWRWKWSVMTGSVLDRRRALGGFIAFGLF